jgi:hypothetical protein
VWVGEREPKAARPLTSWREPEETGTGRSGSTGVTTGRVCREWTRRRMCKKGAALHFLPENNSLPTLRGHGTGRSRDRIHSPLITAPFFRISALSLLISGPCRGLRAYRHSAPGRGGDHARRCFPAFFFLHFLPENNSRPTLRGHGTGRSGAESIPISSQCLSSYHRSLQRPWHRDVTPLE